MRKAMENEIISLLRKRREGLSFQRIARELHVLPGEKQLLRSTLRRLENLRVVLKRKRQYFVPAKSKEDSLPLRGDTALLAQRKEALRIFLFLPVILEVPSREMLLKSFIEIKGKKGSLKDE